MYITICDGCDRRLNDLEAKYLLCELRLKVDRHFCNIDCLGQWLEREKSRRPVSKMPLETMRKTPAFCKRRGGQ